MLTSPYDPRGHQARPSRCPLTSWGVCLSQSLSTEAWHLPLLSFPSSWHDGSILKILLCFTSSLSCLPSISPSPCPYLLPLTLPFLPLPLTLSPSPFPALTLTSLQHPYLSSCTWGLRNLLASSSWLLCWLLRKDTGCKPLGTSSALPLGEPPACSWTKKGVTKF